MSNKDINSGFIYNLFSKETKLKEGIKQDLIVELVDTFLFFAIKNSASDIHIEQTNNNVRVRYRIDGVLYDQNPLKKENGAAVISRLKILSSLDIAEKRIPQDGKILLKFESEGLNKYRLIDLRLSTFPSINGEKVVIRILDRDQNKIDLNILGMDDQTLIDLYSIIDRPQGLFLVTGPTGSGKTTTLYSILSYLNNSEKNIITMEDPVEYNLDGITQSQINQKSGFTFEKGLRSILRQDPDIIMVGEIRDKVTAQITIESALTGHLVLSTLHTNDSIGAITRLIDMGVEPFLISASLSGILAQRLARKLCSECKYEDFLTKEESNLLENHKIEKTFRAKGCSNCLNLGYKSRIGLFELLKVDDNIRDLIIQKSSYTKIKDYLKSIHTNFLMDLALNKVSDGQISINEIFNKLKFD